MAPILFPVAVKMGVDPVHFGILMAVNMEVGLCHPPVGLNLYWFGLIITTAVRFLITGSEGGHSEATEGARGRAKSRKKAD